MNYKILITTLLFQITTLSTSMSQSVGDIQSQLIEGVLANDYVVYYSKEKIDKRFLRFYKKRKNVDLEFVNPGELFNETDVIMKGFPNKRLIIGGNGSKGTNFIIYESGGGNHKYSFCLIYKKQKGRNYSSTVLWFKTKIVSVEALWDIIKEKGFKVLS